MSLRRDLSRLFQKSIRWFGVASKNELRVGKESAPPMWMERLPWLLLPGIFLALAVLGCIQLRRLTYFPYQGYAPVILDAPLPDPHRLPLWPRVSGKYFLLQAQGDRAHLMALQPGGGTRAFRGHEAVPAFGRQATKMELFLSPCGRDPGPQEVRFYTGDGLILWLCLPPAMERRVELRRIGWRFRRKRWTRGLRLGKSATNDIVIGTALIPSRSLRLMLEGTSQNDQQIPPK